MNHAQIARSGRWGLGLFVGAVVVEHLLRPDLPPAEHFVSEYGRGSTRLLQSAAFVAWAASIGAVGVLAGRAAVTGERPAATGGGRAAHRGGRARAAAFGLAAACLAAATVGALMCAAFRTQTIAGELPAGVTRTTEGQLHDLGTLLILAGLVLAAVLVALGVWERRHALAVVGLAVALVAIVPVLVALGIDAPGWGQRAFILVGGAWQLVALRRLAVPA